MIAMEAHTPKRQAIEKFIQEEGAKTRDWQIRIVDEKESPVVRLEAVRRKAVAASGPAHSPKTLEIHTRQAITDHDQIDDSTKRMIRKWLASLE